MDPITSPSLNISTIAQALLLRQGMQPADVEALLQAVGQELSVLLLSQSPEGTKLELPSGRIVTAQGELPFPEGTQLRVRVDADPSGLKLQTLEAKPPGMAAVLAPLLQGEATALTARLTQASPPPDLAPLVQLLRTLGGMPAPSVSPSTLPQAALPSPPLLAKAIAALPPEQIASLAQVLGNPEEAPEVLAATLSALAEDIATSPTLREGLLRMPAARIGEVSRASASAAGELLVRFQGLLQRADIPQDHRTALDGWVRSLLVRKAPEDSPAAMPEPVRTATPRTPVESRILTQAEYAHAEEAVKTQAGPAAQVPEAWEAWIKGSVRALSDPVISPREAPFHELQAKEGTAFFEIPLPWAGGRTLQLWVEDDDPEDRSPGQEKSHRVLLSLKLTQLGETRVGLQSAGSALAVRIWTEHPEMVESQRAEIERELGESGRAVDLRILPLNPGPDGQILDLRALVGGSSLHAIG